MLQFLNTERKYLRVRTRQNTTNKYIIKLSFQKIYSNQKQIELICSQLFLFLNKPSLHNYGNQLHFNQKEMPIVTIDRYLMKMLTHIKTTGRKLERITNEFSTDAWKIYWKNIRTLPLKCNIAKNVQSFYSQQFQCQTEQRK